MTSRRGSPRSFRGRSRLVGSGLPLVGYPFSKMRDFCVAASTIIVNDDDERSIAEAATIKRLLRPFRVNVPPNILVLSLSTECCTCQFGFLSNRSSLRLCARVKPTFTSPRTCYLSHSFNVPQNVSRDFSSALGDKSESRLCTLCISATFRAR